MAQPGAPGGAPAPTEATLRLWTAICDDDESGAEAALRDGACVNSSNPLGATALMVAIRYEDASVVDILLKNGSVLTPEVRPSA